MRGLTIPEEPKRPSRRLPPEIERVELLGDGMALIRTRDGEQVQYRGRKVTIGREWKVVDEDMVVLGYIRYTMVTRERRSGQRRSVLSRWQSPGWEFKRGLSGMWLEPIARSKKACIAAVIGRKP